MVYNCQTPTEKASEFLDSDLKTIMQESWSYKNDSGDFIKNMVQIGDIPENDILVATGIVQIFPPVFHIRLV